MDKHLPSPLDKRSHEQSNDAGADCTDYHPKDDETGREAGRPTLPQRGRQAGSETGKQRDRQAARQASRQ